MCIRDRIVGTEGKTGLIERYFSLMPEGDTTLQDIELSAREMRIGDNRLCPVSYTHLDVYKRQVHFQHPERLPEEVRLDENRLGVNARLLEHGEETVVFLLVETDGVTEHRRVKFGTVSYTHLDVYKRQA